MEKNTCEISIFNLNGEEVSNEKVSFDPIALMEYREDFYRFNKQNSSQDGTMELDLKENGSVKVVPNKLAETVNALVKLNTDTDSAVNISLIPQSLAEDGITLENLLKTENIDIVNSIIIADILKFEPTNSVEKKFQHNIISGLIFKEVNIKMNAKEILLKKFARIAELTPKVYEKRISKDTEAFYELYHINLEEQKFVPEQLHAGVEKLESLLPQVKILPKAEKSAARF